MKKFLRVVLAGGPASGKTETWHILAGEFLELYTVSEAATLLINQFNLKPPLKGELKEAFWYACWRFQELAERLGDAQALVLGKRGVLLDRALADYAAYLEKGEEEFEEVTGLNFDEVFRRYSLVIFLGGPESLDQLERVGSEGTVRLEESFEVNRELTKRTFLVWSRHPVFHFVPYLDDFEDKLNCVRRLVRGFLYPSNS